MRWCAFAFDEVADHHVIAQRLWRAGVHSQREDGEVFRFVFRCAHGIEIRACASCDMATTLELGHSGVSMRTGFTLVDSSRRSVMTAAENGRRWSLHNKRISDPAMPHQTSYWSRQPMSQSLRRRTATLPFPTGAPKCM